jgi:signal transduction histidine kinase
LQQIGEAGRRAAALTRQLLAFSRKQILAPQLINLNGLITNLEKMLARLIGENIDLTTYLAPDLAAIKADPGQIEQVIVNLAVNARDAMPKGGKLTIETDNINLDETYTNRPRGIPAGNYVLLTLSDNGLGMDEATLSRIFEPFFTTKSKDKGTGLGLNRVVAISGCTVNPIKALYLKSICRWLRRSLSPLKKKPKFTKNLAVVKQFWWLKTKNRYSF